MSHIRCLRTFGVFALLTTLGNFTASAQQVKTVFVIQKFFSGMAWRITTGASQPISSLAASSRFIKTPTRRSLTVL